jgi:hypothetical protein
MFFISFAPRHVLEPRVEPSPKVRRKKNSIWISSTTFSKFSKREFFGVRNRESPSYRTHHLPEKALGVAPELGPPNAIFA